MARGKHKNKKKFVEPPRPKQEDPLALPVVPPAPQSLSIRKYRVLKDWFSQQTTAQIVLLLARSFTGPATISGGLSLMPNFFGTGAVFVYVGFLICLAEIAFEPLLGKKALLRTALAVCLFFLCWEFTSNLIMTDNPPDVMAYSAANPENPISGMDWSGKFTDLEVALNNSGKEDFRDFKAVIVPDGWIRTASIEEGPHSCEFKREPGGDGDSILYAVAQKSGRETVTVVNVFGDERPHDSLGSSWETEASKAGYRLRCDEFPSNEKILMRFVMVSIDKDVAKTIFAGGPTPGRWMGLAEYAGHEPTATFGPRPFPSFVELNGTYKTWSNRVLPVHNLIKVDTQN